MSIFSALSIGVAGLQAQDNKIGIISDNIANVNTTGYKEGVTDFQSLLGGSVMSFKQMNTSQSNITGTSSSTDLAISGIGFFPVSQNTPSAGDILFTRAGSFTQDANGNLINGAGYYLQGWLLDINSALPPALSTISVDPSVAIPSLQTVNLQQLAQTPVATTAVSIKANLTASQAASAPAATYDPTISAMNMASGAVAPHFETPVTIIDNLGTAYTCEVGFLKTATNTWAIELFVQPASDVTAADGQVAFGTLTFNGDGSLATISPSLSQPVAITWTDPLVADSSISFNWGTAGPPFGTPNVIVFGKTDGMSQFDEAYLITDTQQNGIQPGNLINISVNSEGYVTGTFDNGTMQTFYKIPLVAFRAPDQLQNIAGNAFAQTSEAGTASFFQPGQSGLSTIQSDALESSNVDLASQLTSMIIAQNAYRSNAKLISTTDSMLQTLNQMLT